MTITLKPLLFIILLFGSCKTGLFQEEATIDTKLEEVSAIAVAKNSSLYWVIEDSGHKNNIYGLDKKGMVQKEIQLSNAKNEDWEALTTDAAGNIYVGDFGNNDHNRKTFTIYKVLNTNLEKNKTEAELINFKLPDDIKSLDFEGFFLYNNYFYLFSKDKKETEVFKFKNSAGLHVAKHVTSYKFKGKNNKITDASISANGKVIALLNHDKVNLLTHFKADAFFSGTIKTLPFNHDSQKEGVCFSSANTLLITDETNKKDGKIYSFSF